MAEVPGGSFNPHAPEDIPISTPPPPPPYVLLPPPPFRPAILPLHSFPPATLPPYPFPPATLPPYPFPPEMLPPYPFPPAMLPPYPFPPEMLPPYPFPPAMHPPYPFPPAMIPLPPPPTVNLPPPENVRPPPVIRQRRQIPPRLGGLERHDVIPTRRARKDETTVMIKNIPSHYNRDMLMQFLDQYCFLENQIARNSNGDNIHVFAYDFLYLPMDFRNWRNLGYALVNFTDQRTVGEFFRAFNDKLNVFTESVKSVEIVISKIQGRNALVRRYKRSRFPCESDRFLPVRFDPPRDGSGESVQMITVGKYNQIDST